MKTFKVALTLIVALLLLSACAKPVPAEAAATPSPAAATEKPAVPTPAPTQEASAETTPTPAQQSVLMGVYEKMKAAVSMPEMMQVSGDLVLDFYGFDSKDFTDGVFYVCADSLKADEVVLLTCTDEAAAKKMASQLNDRLKAKAEEAKGYSPEQYAIIQKCSVIENGLQLAMIVSPDAPALVKVYTDLVK